MVATNGARAFVAGWLLFLGGPAYAAANLSVDVGAPATYTPGNLATPNRYTLTVGNTGDADTAAVSINFPSPTTLTWTCTPSGGATCGAATGATFNQNVTLPQNGSLTWAIDVRYPSSENDPSLTVTATADDAGSMGQPPSDSASSTLQRVTAVSVNKTSPLSIHLPLGGATYTVAVTNAGPSDAPNVTVSDPEPAGVDFLSWTCSRTVGGNPCTGQAAGNALSQTITVPAGATYTYTGTASFALTVPATVTNTATVTVPATYTDADGDDSDSVMSGRDPSIDMTIDLQRAAGATTYTPGTLDNLFTVRVTNGHATSQASAPVSLAFPASVVLAKDWSCTPAAACSTASGTGDIATTVTLAAGASVDIGVSVDYRSDALLDPQVFTGRLDLGPAGVDAVDKTDTLSYDIARRANLSIEKTASSATVPPGGSFTYDLVVRNLGPSDVGHAPGDNGAGALVNDSFALTLAGNPIECGAQRDAPCFRYCPSDDDDVGAYTITNCPVTPVQGFGNLVNQPMRLRAGSSSTVKVFAAARTSASGNILNTATVAMAASATPVTETSAADNSDDATVAAVVTTDLQVTKDDGKTNATAGEELSYTVTVVNGGFNTASGVEVDDALPLFSAGGAGFVPGSIRWQCRAFDGGCCTHQGAAGTCGATSPTPAVFSDVLDASVDLGPLSRVEFTVTGRTDPSSTGTLTNTVTITPPAGLPDVDTSNNTDSDDTVMETVAALSVTKRLLSITPDGAGYDMVYEIVASNAGPSRAGSARVLDNLDSPLDASGASWTCSVVAAAGNTGCGAATGTGKLDTLVALGVGGSLRFEVSVPTEDDPSNPIGNTVTVQQGTNNLATATVVSPLRGEGDLQISKTDFVDSSGAVVPGTEHEYVITVSNQGNDDVFGAPILDRLPPEFESAAWQCAATTPVPGDLAFLSQSGGNAAARALAVSPDGRHLYVANAAAKSVTAYSRVATPGFNFGLVEALETETDGQNDAQDIGTTVSGLQQPQDVAVSPDGAMVFVLSRKLDALPSSLVAFNRVSNAADPAFGKLVFAGSFTTGLPGDAPVQLEVSATHVYVSGSTGIAIFRRSPGNGLPTFDQLHVAGVPSNAGPLAISIAENRLFAASATGSGMASFSISDGSDGLVAGRLALLGSFSDADFTGMSDLVAAADGQHLYAMATGSGRIGVVSYAGSGANALVRVAGYTAAGFGTSSAGAFGSGARLAVAPDGEHVLVTQGSGTPALIQLRRDVQGGGLTFEDELNGAAAPGVSGAADLEVAPDGRHVFVASSGNAKQLAVFTRRAPDPVFGFVEVDQLADDATPGLPSPSDVAVSSDGRHVYAVSLGDGKLVAYRRNARSGEDSGGLHLQPMAIYGDGPGIQGLNRASRVLVSPDRKFVFVSSEDNNTVAVFDRNDDEASPDFGRLTFHPPLFKDGVAGVDGLLGAQGMAMDAGSGQLYVAGSFESAVATFRRVGNDFQFVETVKGGVNGATGMGGMRDLVVSADGRHVMGVGSLSNAVVVLERNLAAGADLGRLRFLQARTTTGVRLMSIAVPSTALNPGDDEHVYVVGQDDDSVIVLKRVVDPASTAFGTLSTLHEYRGLPGLDGARDIAVSPDGRRVFVASQYGNSIAIFDRDLNRSSTGHGGLQPLEVRLDDADGADGLDSPYALAVSGDGRHVYVAGFDDRAIASFGVGAGSYCSAAGSGDIEDAVSIGAGGTVQYRLKVFVRPDATGQLCNTAEIGDLPNFTDTDLSNNRAEDCSPLVPQGALSISKTDGQLSVVAGSTVRYTVRVDNPGPSSLVHDAGNPLTVSDLLDQQPGFVDGSARWTCVASDSGALDFVQARFDGEANLAALGGVSDLALVGDPDGAGPLPPMLAAASVLDDSLTLFARDASDGRLAPGATATLAGVDSLAGARAVVARGRFVYVAARGSDAVTAFRIDAGPTLVAIDVERTRVGLDQASHLVLSGDGKFLYVAGANDDGIAVFAVDAVTGQLAWVESEQNNINDAGDAGGTVEGLDGVEFLVVSPDDAQLYALSGATGSIARFDRDPATGRLLFRDARDSIDFAVDLAGAGGAAFDPTGEYLYVAAANANRLVVLGRRTSPAAGNYGELRLLSSLVQDTGGVAGLLSPRRVVLSGDARHVYVTAQAGSSVAWFGRDPFDGSLRFLGLRSLDSGGVDGMQGATGLALDPVLDQVYVAGTLQSAVVQFERQSDSFCPPSGTGELDQVPVNIGAGGSVEFTIDVDVESSLAGPLVNVASVESVFDADTSDNEASDSNEPSRVADLRITKDDGLAAYDGLLGARALAGDAKHLYVAGAADNAIGHFTRDDAVGANFGALHFASVTRSGSAGVLGLGAVSDLLLGSDGKQLYAVSPTENSVAVFDRGAADGKLAFVEVHRNGVLGVAGMSGARAAALTADGRHVYVVAEFSNALVTFARDPATGKLAYAGTLQNGVAGVDGLLQPTAVAASPDGMHVYTLGNNGSTLAVFRRNPNPGSGGFGQLTYLTRYTGAAGGSSGLESARSLAFDGSGANLYVLGSAPGTLAQFTRTAASGELALTTRLVQGTNGTLGLAGAQRVRLAPGGTQLLVAGGSDNSLSVFDLAGGVPGFASRIANGEPVAAGGLVNGLAGASDVLATADGAHVYAVSATDAALAGFDRAGAVLSHRETFFDGLGGVAPGELVRYRIEVSNAGPGAVNAARVVDNFPPQFIAASWTCGEQLGGALCAASGNGNLDQQVNLPAGASLVFEATGVLGDAVSGTLVNTATVTGIGVTDPDITDNSATDGNTVLSPALDLVASIPSSGGSGVPGGDLEYHARIDNLGPTYATGARITDVVPPALQDVSWTCRAFPLAGLLADLQALSGTLLTPAAPGLPPGVVVAQVQALAPSALGRQVYAAVRMSDGVDAVLVLARDPLDGRLSPAQLLRDGSGGVGGLAGATDVVLSGDERFVYVAAGDADAITVFARDGATGQLAFVARYTDGELGIDGIGGVQRLLLAPGGAHLYAAGTFDDAIALFAVNPGTGLLTLQGAVRQSQPGMDGLNGVTDLAWSAGNTHLIAIAADNQSLAAFSRNPVSGALARVALLQEFELGSGALAAPVALEVGGARVFVASANGRVGEFAFDAAAPAFSAAGTPLDTGAAVDDLVFETDQARLYVAQAAAGQVLLYNLLGSVPAPLDAYAASAGVLARAPDGRQLYGGGDGLQAWARERGSRCPLAGEGGIGVQFVDIAPGGRVEFDVGGLLFANATGELVYEIEAQARDLGAERVPADNVARDVRTLHPRPQLGASKSDGLSDVVAGLPVTYTMGLDNTGQSAAIGARLLDPAPVFPASPAGLAAGSGAWTCAVDPALATAETRTAAGSGDAALQGVGELAVSADGTRAYAVNASRDALLVFARQPDGSLGTLREIRDGDVLGTAVQGLDGASAVAVSGDGRTVLVTGASSNSLVVFAHDGAGNYTFLQKLTSGVDNVVGLLGPEDVQFDRDDRHVYVASPGSDSIAQFTRDGATGRLAFVQRVRDGFGTIAPDSEVIRRVHRLWLSDDGANLYALARGQNGANAEAVSSFALGSDGTPSYLGVIRRSAVPQLAGLRDVTAAPGDPQLYVLGDAAVVRLQRQADGRLQFHSAMTGTPGLVQPRAIVADAPGARVYLVDGGGAVAVYARDWSSGELAFRQRVAAIDPAPAASAFAVHDAVNGELLVSAGDAGRLLRHDERPLSYCRSTGATGDAIDTLLDLDVGGHASVVFAARVHPSARGTLINQIALAAAAGSDPGAATAFATDNTLIRAVSDISIEKTAPSRAVAGEDITYDLRVHNAGPSDAIGLHVQDALAAALSNARWTCSAPAGSSCPASGSGVVDIPATLEVGDELVIAVTARVASSFLGTLANTATLVPEPGSSDPSTADHADGASTEVVAEADVVVTKDDGVARVVAGDSTTYRIVVSNPGPSDTMVVVRDPLPAGVRHIGFTCSASGGAACPQDLGVGVNFDASMPAGAVLTIDALAMIDDDARGQVSNVVTATLPKSVLERDPDDNRAEDIDAIDVVADLAVDLRDGLDPFDPNGSTSLPYVVDIDNLGPSSVDDAVLAIDFGRPVTLSPPAGCVLSGNVLACDIGHIAGGGHARRSVEIGNLPAAPATYTITASVSSGETDPVPGNNTDSESTQLATGGDVVVTIVRTTGVVGGDPVAYDVLVRNAGSQIVANFNFKLTLPSQLLGTAWTCMGTGSATCAASGSGSVDTTLSLASGESVRYAVTGTVDATLDRAIPIFVDVSAVATVAPGQDINPANNSALDHALIQWGIFRDGFESLVAAKRNGENAR